jgi:DNA modification methylase
MTIHYERDGVTLHLGDCRESMRQMEPESVQCCITSPPYFGLRDYGAAGQLGLEPTPGEYVANMVEVFREVWRVLRDDGTCWINLGDSYAGCAGGAQGKSGQRADRRFTANVPAKRGLGLKPKDLIGIPWRVAFALQADGWYLRQDIIWCLSGGTWLYVRTQKGDMPMTVNDLARLNPATVQLWNGEKWTRLLGMNKSARRGDELEIVLRSGERISCTPTHRFPTTTGLVDAADLKVGDALMSCRLPEPESPRDCIIDEDAAWFAGLYVAEGSRSGDKIQISGHSKEYERWRRVQQIAAKFGGSATMSESGNNQSIRVYGKLLNAIIDELVTGRTAHDKGFAPVVWRYSNRFIAAMVDGYLSGDGCAQGNRWRLNFCRNYNLERDLRTACARLGYTLTLNLASIEYDGRRVPTFRGELRKKRSGHHNERDRNEIVEIRKARCREVYDLGVADEPHLFALASGVLTHNSKPNPMPESVRDRCTKAHEYLFLLSKKGRYFFDAEAVKEPATHAGRVVKATGATAKNAAGGGGAVDRRTAAGFTQHDTLVGKTRNRRSVWTVSTKPFSGAHFATFPPDLIEPCVLAGSRAGDLILDPFNGAGTTGLVALKHGRRYVGCDVNPAYLDMSAERIAQGAAQGDMFRGAA